MLLAGIIAVGICIAVIACLLEYSISDVVLTSAVALYDSFNKILWYAGEAKNNSEIKIPNSSVVLPKTIFAFLMLNTMS